MMYNFECSSFRHLYLYVPDDILSCNFKNCLIFVIGI